MKVAIYQPSRNLGLEDNFGRMIDFINSKRAHLYVFPELYLTGYLIRDDLYLKALTRSDERFDIISKMMREKRSNVIFGFPEKENGFLYNSAMAIDEKGDIHVYRKMRLPNFGPFEEMIYFKPGNETVTFDTSHGRIGIEICYDIFFPFITQELAMKGSEYIVNISASPVTSRALFEMLIPVRAVENSVFFIYNNWAGTQRNIVFWGGSTIVSPRGAILKKAQYIREEIVEQDLNEDEIRIARTFRPVLRDL
ncbi:MAG: carbon-nitrogen hydrolase family protein [Aciduliprofundum sp.]|jgi:predicted amidohydrolase|nr:MAG: carbon-nitrogen hydrolase family protein [Aciduliprofundum sp.]